MDEALELILVFALGVFVGWTIARYVGGGGSVVFDRDQQGRVVAIHYVPHGGRAGS